MLDRLSRTKRNLALAVLLALVLWFAWSIRAVVNPLILGYIMAAVVHPMVQRLESVGMSRRAAVNWIFFFAAVVTIVVGAGVFLQARGVVRDVLTDEEMASQLTRRLDQVTVWMRDTIGVDLSPGEDGDWAELRARLAESLTRSERGVEAAGRAGLQVAEGVGRFLGRMFGSIAGFAALVVLLPLYTYYLLFELEGVNEFVRRYLPRRERERVTRIVSQVGEVLASFFRGRLVVCLLKGTVLTLGLWAAQVPYAFLLGMGSGFLSLIPVLGPLFGFVVAAILSLLEHGPLSALLRTGIVFSLGELIEGYVLIPKVLGDSLGLHPVVVLFALLAGGAALGFFGVLIALPLTASLVIVAREFVLPVLASWADE